MGSVPVMTQPTLIYSQPVMRPPNPFGPVSGAQVLMMRVTVVCVDLEGLCNTNQTFPFVMDITCFIAA